MNWLDKLERKYARFGIPNLMLYVVFTMIPVFVLDAFPTTIQGYSMYNLLSFVKSEILRGQVWRIVTFIFLPTSDRLLWFALSLLFYYFIAQSLEGSWGTFRFTVYYICGMIGTIIAGFIVGYATNFYLNTTLFLAFATLFPNSELRLYFVIPVKAKYIGYATWIIIGLEFLRSLVMLNWTIIGSIIASLINYALFFGGDIKNDIQRNFKYKKGRDNFKKQDFWK